MSVTITTKSNVPYPLLVKDIKEGRAYKDSYDTIYIGNMVNKIKAFSVCGRYIIDENSVVKLEEIHLEIKEI